MITELSLKGKIGSQGSIAIQLSSNISVGTRGGIIIINGRLDMKPYTDYNGRVDHIVLESYGHPEGNVEISYSGEYISKVRYDYGRPDECYFYYENGKLSKVSGPNGTFKVIWDSFNDVSRGERI